MTRTKRLGSPGMSDERPPILFGPAKGGRTWILREHAAAQSGLHPEFLDSYAQTGAFDRWEREDGVYFDVDGLFAFYRRQAELVAQRHGVESLGVRVLQEQQFRDRVNAQHPETK